MSFAWFLIIEIEIKANFTNFIGIKNGLSITKASHISKKPNFH